MFGLMGPLRSKQPTSQTPAGLSSPTTTSQTLYTQALQAQASGDVTRTVQLAQAALDANPNNAEAKTLLETALRADKSPAMAQPSTSTSTAPAVDRDAAFRKKYDEPRVAAARRIQPGFALDIPVQFGRDINDLGQPGARRARRSRRYAWAVHDMKTTAGAKSFVTKTSKKLFPQERGTARSFTARRGISAPTARGLRQYAFARGRYAFEVLVTVNGAPIDRQGGGHRGRQCVPGVACSVVRRDYT